MTEWQDIETAPKDGESFVAVERYIDEDGPFQIYMIGYWHEGRKVFHYGGADEGHWDRDFTPSHWSALSDPPTYTN